MAMQTYDESEQRAIQARVAEEMAARRVIRETGEPVTLIHGSGEDEIGYLMPDGRVMMRVRDGAFEPVRPGHDVEVIRDGGAFCLRLPARDTDTPGTREMIRAYQRGTRPSSALDKMPLVGPTDPIFPGA